MTISLLPKNLQRRRVLFVAASAVVALAVILGGCFQKPGSLAPGNICQPTSFAALQTVPGAHPAKEQRLQSGNISLFIWNSYKGNRDGWLTDLAALSDTHQLILLQEASLGEELLAFLAKKKLSWNIATTFKYQSNPTGVLTASRVVADMHCRFTAMEPWIRLPKAILISRYKLTGTEKDLVVANVHLINFTLGTEPYSRQLDTLKTIVEQHDGPLIIAGDFNTWNGERARLVQKFTADLKLTPVDFEKGERSQVFGKDVDHVYYRGMTLSAAKGIEVSTSDHNPMVVSFSLQEAYP